MYCLDFAPLVNKEAKKNHISLMHLKSFLTVCQSQWWTLLEKPADVSKIIYVMHRRFNCQISGHAKILKKRSFKEIWISFNLILFIWTQSCELSDSIWSTWSSLKKPRFPINSPVCELKRIFWDSFEMKFPDWALVHQLQSVCLLDQL